MTRRRRPKRLVRTVTLDDRLGLVASGPETDVRPFESITCRHPMTGRRVRLTVVRVQVPGGWDAVETAEWEFARRVQL